jgi:ABC-type Fe3+/spermidine/putrescine transport system ATPase subunit
MIRLAGVSLTIGSFRLRSIDLEVNRGEYFAILGPSGAGKTKLLECVAGLEFPSAGEISIDDRNVTELPPERRNIGLMYQDYLLFPHLTVRKNITFGLRAALRSHAGERVAELADLLKIDHLLDRSITGLSGGEQQRVALARALVTGPRALLLDEPLSALDPQSRKSLRRELGLIHRQLGMTTVHVTHDFEEAMVLADRIAVMSEGEIVQVGPPEEVFRRPASAFVAEFFGLENLFKGEIVFCESGGSGEAYRDALFRAGALSLRVVADREGPGYITIRPEEISVSLEMPHSSALNNLCGAIVDIERTGPLVRLRVDAGLPFVAVLTAQSLVSLQLHTGLEIHLSFKAAAIHVF